MDRKLIVIIGSSFAGYTAAISLANGLKERHEIVVISDRDQFVFVPSLIWLPFGARVAKDISFDLVPVYRKRESFLRMRVPRASTSNAVSLKPIKGTRQIRVILYAKSS
jgi:NADH dehydrogenase FAD-containing subunit